ncbi:YfjI family protein [Escherichia coli]|uniref:YfjI family protein n=1 Tax=Escherichia coli TaxID=562 RepID=UPI000BB6D710|nr:YfjI family protein [Escherichia coli]HAK9881612.1 DUF3987 domain-containing protein [Escherichia coli]
MTMAHPFPVHVFPTLIKNAIYEVEQHTQAPQSLIAASILGAVSIASQNSIDVCRLNNLRSPVSLFLVTLAESGERKSTVDKMLMKPLYTLDEQLFSKYVQDLSEWKILEAIFIAEKKALISKLKSDIRREKNANITNERLKILLDNYPVEPMRYKLMFNDATPAAIKDYLCGNWRSVGIMSDEAGTIFDGYALNELPFINKMWDGSTFSVERKSTSERLIKDARLTLSLMVQPDIFKDYLERKGDIAKGVGFLARCLICQPNSTQGQRTINNSAFSSEHLPMFHNRLIKIVNEGINRHNEKERLCLRFSPDAEQHWISFYNSIEKEMGVTGQLSNFKDYASKITENMVRIAALLHHFNGDVGDISISTTNISIEIIKWYVHEYIRLFSKAKSFTLEDSDTDALYFWMVEYCTRKMTPCIKKNDILQYGPNKFRKNEKINELLGTLYSQNKILAFEKDRTLYIELLNPSL